ncbi:MAG TPA: ATP-binding cassette domain-containing protein [Kofleriaceae bacterium]|nr:ATP-binding cassette domain-containing protein [Kofleriaceae bacterium]
MVAIKIENLSKSYDRIQALSGVSFEVGAGEVIGLLGPNGAGKTTLMKILTGYLEPDEGDVRIHGIDVVEDPLAAQRRVGYLPESAPLYSEMLVQEYLEMMAAMRGVPYADRQDRTIEAIRATGLEDRAVQTIGTLSKGYRQRVGIAQAIIHQPDILILDEPTNGLDPTQIAEIRDLIRRLSERTTVLLSTHILSEIEATCERVVIIMRGQLRADAKLADLRSSNEAVLAVEAGATGVAELLRGVPGVTKVEPIGEPTGELEGGFQRFRVASSSKDELCPALFDKLRGTSWKLGELRPEPKTLERVFRDLAQRAGDDGVDAHVPASTPKPPAPKAESSAAEEASP